jgi:hypothetical protein
MFIRRTTSLSISTGATLRRTLCALFILVALTEQAAAEVNPEPIVLGVIQQLQTGTPNPTWYSPDLWQTLAIQTGNTGKYPALIAIGTPIQVYRQQQQPFPTGLIYALKVQHSSGISLWNIGVSFRTQRIELLVFNIDASPTGSPTAPQASSSPYGNFVGSRKGLEGASPDMRPGAPPIPNTDACSRFPNLC